MERVTSALQAAQSGLRAKATNATPGESENNSASASIRRAALRRFWMRMAAIYGHRWTSGFGEGCEHDDGKLTVAGDTWQRGLTGLSEAQIAAGLQSALTSADPWPPTLPRFRALCFGIPSIAEVRLDLKRDTKRPFTRMVWSYIDSYRYRNASSESADFLLKDAYEIAREAVMSGAPLPDEIAGTIDAPQEQKPVPASPEVAMRYIEEIQRKLGGADEPENVA